MGDFLRDGVPLGTPFGHPLVLLGLGISSMLSGNSNGHVLSSLKPVDLSCFMTGDRFRLLLGLECIKRVLVDDLDLVLVGVFSSVGTVESSTDGPHSE